MHQHYAPTNHSHVLHLTQKASLDEEIPRLRRSSSYSRKPTPVTPVTLPSLAHQLTNALLAAEPATKRRTGEWSERRDEGTDLRVNVTCRIVGHAHRLALCIPLECACEAVGRRLIRQFCIFTWHTQWLQLFSQ
jgi:hypothetical protein